MAVKVFEVDFRKGTTVDSVNGIVAANGIGQEMIRGEKGFSIVNKQSTISTPYRYIKSFTTGTYSYVTYIKPMTLSSQSNIFYNTTSFQVCFLNNGVVETATALNGTPFVNGVQSATTISKQYNCIILNGATVVTNGELFLLSSNSGANSLNGYMAYFAVYSGTLTEKERANIYKDFLNSYPILPEKYPQQNIINKPMDLSREKENTSTLVTESPINLNTWAISGDGIAVVNNYSFSSTRGNTGLQKAVTTAGKRYRYKIRGSKDPGIIDFGIRHIGSGTYYSSVFTSNTFNEVGVFTSIGNPYLVVTRTVGSALLVTIDELVIEEVTGLVAAYNMIPNGNVLTDISGNGKNGTIVNGITTKNGIKLRTTSSYISLPATDLSGYKFTYMFRFDLKSISTPYAALRDNNGSLIRILNSLAINYYPDSWSGSITSSAGLTNGVENTVIVSQDNNNVDIYINNIKQSFTGVPLPVTRLTANAIGKEFTASNPAEFTIIDYRFYNRKITDKEANDYHNSFVKPYFIEDFKSESADGIAKVPVGWSKTAGSFKVGELPKSGQELVTNGGFNGSTGWTTFNGGSIANGVLNTTSANMYSGAKQSISISANKLYKVEYDLVSFTPLSDYGIVVSFQQPGGGSGVADGRNSTIGRRTVYLLANALTSEIWFQGTLYSEATIDNVSVREVTLPTLKNGSRYLEGLQASSSMVIPCNMDYGTWEFDLYQGSTSNMAIFLTDKAWIGYGLQLTYGGATGSIWLLAVGSGIWFYTNNGVFNQKVWYRLKLEKKKNGILSTYIMGGSYGNNWTLVSNIASGANPSYDGYRDINKMAILLHAGDRIANIKLTPDIIV